MLRFIRFVLVAPTHMSITLVALLFLCLEFIFKAYFIGIVFTCFRYCVLSYSKCRLDCTNPQKRSNGILKYRTESAHFARPCRIVTFIYSVNINCAVNT